MRTRPFGATGLRVSEIGVGCSRLGGLLAPGSSRKEELALLGEAVDAGITFFDTSDLYSQGQSEVVLGQAMRHRRDEVVIATKGGYLVASQRRLVAKVKPLLRPVVQRLPVSRRPGGSGGGGGGEPIPQDFSPAHLRVSVEASLKRLGTDRIDVYQLHSPSRDVIDAGGYVEVLESLKEQGKIRHYGIAADTPDDVVDVARHPGIASVQLPYSLLHPEARDHVLPEAQERGVAAIARTCFAAGLFKETLTEDELRALTPDAPAIIRIRRQAAALGRPVLEAALQFSLAGPGVSVTLLGMRTPAHLRDNLRLYDAGPLTADELAALTSEVPDEQH